MENKLWIKKGLACLLADVIDVGQSVIYSYHALVIRRLKPVSVHESRGASKFVRTLHVGCPSYNTPKVGHTK